MIEQNAGTGNCIGISFSEECLELLVSDGWDKCRLNGRGVDESSLMRETVVAIIELHIKVHGRNEINDMGGVTCISHI